MLSAVISSAHRQPAVLLAEQLAHERCVRPGPLVLGTAFLKPPAPTVDRDRHFCYRDLDDRGSRHFCVTLHVPMQIGPYLRVSRRVRHMVSEDSGLLHSSHSSIAPSAVHGEGLISKRLESF